MQIMLPNLFGEQGAFEKSWINVPAGLIILEIYTDQPNQFNSRGSVL